jgi:hypothetical protein
LFMVAAIESDELIHEAPAIVGCRTPSALAHAASGDGMVADNRGNASERQSEIGSSAPRRR